MSSNEPGAGRGSDEAVRGNRSMFARLRDQFTPARLREVQDRFVRAINPGRGSGARPRRGTEPTHPQNDNLGRNSEPDIAELMGDDAGLRAARERPALVANIVQAERRALRLQAASERASQIPPPYENPEQDVTLPDDGRSVAQLEWEASQAQRTSTDGGPEPAPRDDGLHWAALSRNMALPRASRGGIPRGWGNELAPLYPVLEDTPLDSTPEPSPTDEQAGPGVTDNTRQRRLGVQHRLENPQSAAQQLPRNAEAQAIPQALLSGVPLGPVAEGTPQDRGGVLGPESPIPSDSPPPYPMPRSRVGHPTWLGTVVQELNEDRDPSALLRSSRTTRALGIPQEWLDQGRGPESPLVGEQEGARVVTDVTRSRRSSIEGQIREEQDARQGRGSSEHEM
jgi:hypothetical protein